jgi:PTH2 family peptidyl-tRNA hydrolase
MSKTKQVIIIRKDLKMRRGKEISQGAHASMGVFTKRANFQEDPFNTSCHYMICDIDRAMRAWLEGSFAKVVVTVQTEQELIDLEIKAKEAKIPCCLIEDNGITEFNGVKTKTALAIGPWWPEEIDKITGTLPLY